jgi:hypothetical protein
MLDSELLGLYLGTVFGDPGKVKGFFSTLDLNAT